MSKPLVASTRPSQYFADRIAEQLGVGQLQIERGVFGGSRKHLLSPAERELFGDGEKHIRLDIKEWNELSGRDVILVGATHTDDALLDVQRVGYTLAANGARQIVIVNPFYGYSTMERAKKPGQVITAKTNAVVLSRAIKSGQLGNSFLLHDLHVQTILGFFEGSARAQELYGQSVLVPAIERLGLGSIVIASADLGHSDWVEAFAKKFKSGLALISKERVDETSHVNAVIGDVHGKNVVIVDDMTRSGTTAVNAADAYLNAGAKDVHLVLSHFAINDPSVADLLQTSCIKKIITTNTHPASQWVEPSGLFFAGADYIVPFPYTKFEVLDVSPIFVRELKIIFGLD